MPPLTVEERAKLRDSEFAVPGKRELPLHDADHAKLAWDMLDKTHGLDDYERDEARHRIIRALHRHGVKFGGDVQEADMAVLAGGESGVCEATIADAAAHVVEVTIARPGVSNNGMIYTDSVLRDATPLWEGAPAFLDHPTALDLTRAGTRSLRDLVGVYEGATFVPGRGIRARLKLGANDHGVFATVRESIEAKAAGRASPPVGISADWRVLRSPAKAGADGRARWHVHSITAVNSGDLVVRPSAGGSFDRVLEAERPVGADYATLKLFGEGNAVDPTRTAPSAPGEAGNVGSTVVQPSGGTGVGGQGFGDRVGETVQVRESTAVAAVGSVGASGDRSGSSAGVPAGIGVSESALAALVDRATLPLRQQLAAQVLEARLMSSGLPAPAQSMLRSQFAQRVFESTEVDTAIAGLKGMLGEVFGQSSIRGVGAPVLDPGRPQGIAPGERLQAAFDRLFGLDVPGHLANVPRLTGIREAYILVTGDKYFTGAYQFSQDAIVREANEVTTGGIANVVLNSMTKRLVKDYQAQPKWWEPFTIKVPVTDMKQQNRIRLNDFASLSTVAEDGAYTNLAWGDARENYTPSKFGNLVVVTLEAFLNDDLHAIMRIPTKVAHAAVVTVNEQVATLFTQSAGTGPAMSDTFHVFDATNHQGNTSATTPAMDLASSSLETAMIVLEKMQNTAGKRIGVRGRYLLVPPDLRWTAAVITQSQYATGSANNDINPLQGAVMPIVVPQFTTAYQWYLMADPAQVESIEIGFLNGREEPELLVQDNPTQGQVFTNDAISYKVRHIYGLGWLDYRGAFAALPTS